MSVEKVLTDWEESVLQFVSDSQICRLFGGRAVRHHLVGRVPDAWLRPPGDVDLFTVSAHRKTVTAMLEHIGLVPEREFNLLQGKTRLIYWAGDEKVDVFIDEFQMCHRLDLRSRLGCQQTTLPLADLALTKLQIYQLTEKDMRDLFALLYVAPLGATDQEGVLNVKYLAQVLAKDWGLWRTCTGNLKLLREKLPFLYPAARADIDAVDAAIVAMLHEIDVCGKSMAWRGRAVVGERVKWYELPEEP